MIASGFWVTGAGGNESRKRRPYAHGAQPWVEDGQDAAIGAMADEPPESLQHREDRQRHLVVLEGVAALGVDRLDARGRNRIARRGERQLVDDHAAQLFADDIDPLPERRGRKQHRVRRRSELREQCAARRRALDDHRVWQIRLDEVADRAQHGVAREQHECAALGPDQQVADFPRHGVAVLR